MAPRRCGRPLLVLIVPLSLSLSLSHTHTHTHTLHTAFQSRIVFPTKTCLSFSLLFFCGGHNIRFVDADVVVLKDWRWMADANYFLYPDAPYNSKFGSRKPDIIMQMDGYSKENAFMDLSDPENRDEIPKGCAGFFFLRKTVPSVNLLKKLLAAFEVLGDVDDQPVLNGFFRNSSYVRFLDVHPNHPISYLHTDEQGRRFEPEILAKLLPQLEFANGGVLLYHDYKETEYWVVHPNGFGSKELELQRRGLWYLDGYHQCIFQVNQGNKTKWNKTPIYNTYMYICIYVYIYIWCQL